ncbi:MAG: ABC transporter permease [Rhizobiales bacterium]|nr:ABC transporter permease [Hyphomicrobiales bacterium]MBI3672128.1 ABC transporter permease [Hyphomicrobiales bacterium]
MALPAYATPGERIAYYALRLFVGLVLLFLISPILAIMPLSFNSESFFTYPMPGFSLKWYIGDEGFFTNGRWTGALYLSVIVAVSTTALASVLGTLAALGLARANLPGRAAIMAVLISPMIVPVIISAIGLFFFYASPWVGLNGTIPGIILAHTALATPFVVITVTATLMSFDRTLMRAGASCGAPPHTVFFKVVMPLILPGVISGGLFAFVTSFDEVIVILFIGGPEQRTLPRQMFAGIREQISPTITAAATVLILFSTALLITVELLRRRAERLRGIRN